MLEQLNEELKRENDQVAETEQSADNLAAVLADLTEELKVTKRQRIREIMKKPEQEASIEALYDEMEADLQKKIDGIHHQIDLLSDKRNTIIQVNRVAKTAIDVFRDILEKDKLERNDLELLIDKILVFEDHLEIRLQSDIDTLLRCGTLPAETEDAANFKLGTENIETTLIQSSKNHEDKVFRVSVISSGDPLEIYTEKDGEVIFKKYSPMGDLGDFAGADLRVDREKHRVYRGGVRPGHDHRRARRAEAGAARQALLAGARAADGAAAQLPVSGRRSAGPPDGRRGATASARRRRSWPRAI